MNEKERCLQSQRDLVETLFYGVKKWLCSAPEAGGMLLKNKCEAGIQDHVHHLRCLTPGPAHVIKS